MAKPRTIRQLVRQAQKNRPTKRTTGNQRGDRRGGQSAVGRDASVRLAEALVDLQDDRSRPRARTIRLARSASWKFRRQLAPFVVILLTWLAGAVAHVARQLEPQLGDRGVLAHVTDWASKLAGASVRLAGLLHLAENIHTGWNRPISAAVLDSAIRVARYYLSHALAVFDNVMSADPTVDDARYLLDWIARHVTDGSFTRRDLYVSVHGNHFAKVTDVQPGLDLLEQHSYIRRVESTPGSRGGRPSVFYAVHPSVVPTKTTEPTKAGDQQ